MDDIPIKALIVDSDKKSSVALERALRENALVLHVESCSELPQSDEALGTRDVNVIYIDPNGMAIDAASDFIFRIREEYPSVVFVLYFDTNTLKGREDIFYEGERRRFAHYFTLDKAPDPDFARSVHSTIAACQGDLAFSLTQEKIESLQKELIGIQESAADDTATIPLTILKDIQEQLSAIKNERRSPGISHAAAPFLGIPASSITPNRCFIIMPYSQDGRKALRPF